MAIFVKLKFRRKVNVFYAFIMDIMVKSKYLSFALILNGVYSLFKR